MNVICFHNPDEENGYLSNWYLSQFSVDEITFPSMEQYMMHKKAVCFQDYDTAGRILETEDVSQIKKLGRKVSNYDENYWNGVRQIVVYRGLLEKFGQNDELKKLLLETGDSVLAECAVKDRIWGTGLSMTDPDRLDRACWKGQNLLGYALMMVREALAMS
ncbi:NADAR family protein [Hornefia butyriciproducens]|uniref:NADAR family protein n=1 Tax=Hornefia butyriciproducens TaxID=2652293 RepID=UPI0023F03F51|nr:NADAR family protein [Hornefia butyriciproducens]MDD6299674.1 NADAR family protein [Hornefia butyriciproducens]